MVRLLLLLLAMAAPGLVDTRLLDKPRTYGGNKSEWTSWKYVLRSYLGAVNPELLQPLQESEAALTPIALDALEEKQQANARTISFVLSQVLVGAPLQLIMNISDMNGFEMWRQLVKAEEPSVGAAQVTQLTSILSTKFTSQANTFAEELQRLEGAILEYERRHTELLPDSLHQAILKANAPSSDKNPG